MYSYGEVRGAGGGGVGRSSDSYWNCQQVFPLECFQSLFIMQWSHFGCHRLSEHELRVSTPACCDWKWLFTLFVTFLFWAAAGRASRASWCASRHLVWAELVFIRICAVRAKRFIGPAFNWSLETLWWSEPQADFNVWTFFFFFCMKPTEILLLCSPKSFIKACLSYMTYCSRIKLSSWKAACTDLPQRFDKTLICTAPKTHNAQHFQELSMGTPNFRLTSTP